MIKTGAAEAGGLQPDLDGAESGVSEPSYPHIIEWGVTGYQQSRPAERSAFIMTSSFGLTIMAARTITYIQERHRKAPAVRSVARSLSQVPESNAVRVHHSLPGMFLAFAAGGAAILASSERWPRWLSAPFGVGVALTTDELRLLAGRNNPYWGGRGFAFAQAASATLASGGLYVAFVRRGRSSGGTA